jgi:tetratricopeptide (TPR) repeat protein
LGALVVACAGRPGTPPRGDARSRLLYEGLALAGADRVEAWERFMDLLGTGQPALELFAADRLLALDGERGADASMARRLRERADRLDFEARDRVLELTARILRRTGDHATAREVDRQRGCMETFMTPVRVSPLAHRGLVATAVLPAAARSPAVASYGCRATLMEPGGEAGALATWLAVPKGAELVMIDAPVDWALMAEGKVVYRHGGPDRVPPRAEWIRLPSGTPPLELRLAAVVARVEVQVVMVPAPPGQLAARRLVAATTFGQGIRAVPPPEPNVDGELGRLVRARLLLGRGDADAASELLEGVASPYAMLTHAEAVLADTTTYPAAARERARSLLLRALAAEPRLRAAELALARLDLGDERAREALTRLEGSPESGGRGGQTVDVPWELVRAQALRARGFSAEAERVLQAAYARTQACELVPDLAGFARERHAAADERQLAERLRRCDANSETLADLCAARSDFACAIGEYERLLAQDGRRTGLRRQLADVLIAAGEPGRAKTVLEAVVKDEPRDAHSWQRLADAEYEAGDADLARRTLLAAARRLPDSLELARALETLGEPSPLARFRIDGRVVIREYERTHAKPPPDPAVLLLDRTVLRVMPDGTRLTLTHNIVRVQTKAGIDRWGEVRIPNGADVLTLRTVKADGSTREPEEIAEKETVSVPDLLPGDYVEFEYVEAEGPAPAFSHGFLSDRFYFVSYEAPLDRTEFLVVTPAGTPVDADVRGGMERFARVDRAGDLDVRTWARRQQQEAVEEPDAVPQVEFLPSVRVSSGVSFERWRDYVEDGTYTAWRAGHDMRKAVSDTCAGKHGRACADALSIKVSDEIEHDGSLTDGAIETFARRQGNRTGLLGALLLAAGMQPRVWLVRAITSGVGVPPVQEIEQFDQAVLALDVGDAAGPLLYDPRVRRQLPPGLAPTLREGTALRFASPPLTTTLAQPRPPGEVRRLVLAGRVDEHGALELSGREELSGWPSVEWREAIDRQGITKMQQDFEQRSVGFFFPGAEALTVGFAGLERPRGPLTIDFHFRSTRLFRPAGTQRLTMGAVYPVFLEKRYARVDSRTVTMALAYAAPIELDLSVELPVGAKCTLPDKVERRSAFGQFFQQVTQQGRTLRMVRRVALTATRVAPSDYAAFVAFARTVDLAEQSELSIQLAPPR